MEAGTFAADAAAGEGLGWADVPFRGGTVRVSRHPLPAAAASRRARAGSPDGYGYAAPGLDSMELSGAEEEEEESERGLVRARLCCPSAGVLLARE